MDNNHTIQLTIPIQLSISLGQISQGVQTNLVVTTPTKTIDEVVISSENLLEKIEIDPDYNNREGFDENFLGLNVPMPQLTKKQKDGAAKLIDKPEEMVLKYIHYSLIMCQDRKMPYFTAVNFDGPSYNVIKKNIPTRKAIGNDRWFVDKRIEASAQLLAKFYAGNDFDLGHLVRREDPVWGNTVADAILANNDTYHLTNASPQHSDFNRGKQLWQGLENYILDNARKKNLKVNIFAGPVMAKTDKVFKSTDVQIPEEFWKIVVSVDKDQKLRASGYIVSQKNLIETITEVANVFDDYQTFHVPIQLIEQKTGLKFNLGNADVKASKNGFQENTTNTQVVRLNTEGDFVM
jgi:endonuclease G